MIKIGDNQYKSSNGSVYGSPGQAMAGDHEQSMKRLRDFQKEQERNSNTPLFWRTIGPIIVIIGIAVIVASGSGPAVMNAINHFGRSMN